MRETIHRRRVQDEFLARGLRSGEDAKRSGVYHSAAAVHGELQHRLDARRKRVLGWPLSSRFFKSEVEGQLSRSPFIYRKVGQSPFRRELIIPLRASGYVVPYEIEGGSTVNIVAVRHQLEDDYH